MPWIQNVALIDIERGTHRDPGTNSVLIQIVDPCMEFPAPRHQFKNAYQFEFLDLEGNEGYAEEFCITDEQAKSLVKILQQALTNNSNVIVHCVAGVCRSGAVCEIGVMLGFSDTEVYRNPNLLVKHKMMKVLDWSYE
jgi:predicted protein tyrosine phosphatase